VKKLYAWISAHLTKILGSIGALWLSLLHIPDDMIRIAAATYLPASWAKAVGIGLFLLVIARGWYAGLNFVKRDDAPPPPTAPG
jgi:hypothetical protein